MSTFAPVTRGKQYSMPIADALVAVLGLHSAPVLVTAQRHQISSLCVAAMSLPLASVNQQWYVHLLAYLLRLLTNN